MIHDVSQRGLAVQENAPIEDLLTIPEAMKILKVSRPTVVRLIGRGALPARKVGRQWRFQPNDVRAFIDGKSSNSEPSSES